MLSRVATSPSGAVRYLVGTRPTFFNVKPTDGRIAPVREQGDEIVLEEHTYLFREILTERTINSQRYDSKWI